MVAVPGNPSKSPFDRRLPPRHRPTLRMRGKSRNMNLDLTQRNRRSGGFSLTELSIAIMIFVILISLTVPSYGRWVETQELRSSGIDVQAALSYARGEAIRTGRLHLVFFGSDTGGNSLVDPSGAEVDILVVDEGRPGSAGQNCSIGSGEARLGWSLDLPVEPGVTAATSDAPADSGGGDRETGSTFVDADGVQANWIMFRPEGNPVAFSSDCSLGTVGSGSGGIYLTNGARDVAVVLSPLGMPHVHWWEDGAKAWSE